MDSCGGKKDSLKWKNPPAGEQGAFHGNFSGDRKYSITFTFPQRLRHLRGIRLFLHRIQGFSNSKLR